MASPKIVPHRSTLLLRTADDLPAELGSARQPVLQGRRPGENTNQIVWFPIGMGPPEDWVPCKLIEWSDAAGAKLRTRGNIEVAVEPARMQLICPQPDGASNSTDLAGLFSQRLGPENLAFGPENVEEELRNHFCSNLPYTTIGNTTLFVNPFRQLPIYEETWIQKYSALNSTLPPHIYDVAAKAYNSMKLQRRRQNIFLVGEPCTGKSKSMGHLLGFCMQRAGKSQIHGYLELLLQLIRPFVSVYTHSEVVSWPSTRALFSLDLYFDGGGHIRSAQAFVHTLEVGRLVPEQTQQGACFEAFLLALKSNFASLWIGDIQNFRLMGSLEYIADYDKKNDELNSWTEALKFFGFNVDEIVRTLCGILMLTEVQVEGEGSEQRFASPEKLEAAASALGIDVNKLKEALLQDAKEEEEEEDEGGAGKTASVAFAIQMTAIELYARTVTEILRVVNTKLDSEPRRTKANDAIISITEIPSLIQGSDAPTGLDAVRQHLISELLYQQLLESVRDTPKFRAAQASEEGIEHTPVMNFCRRHRAAQAAVEALVGASSTAKQGDFGLLDIFSAIDDKPWTEGEYSTWAAKFSNVVKSMSSFGPFTESSPEIYEGLWHFELHGASYKHTHKISDNGHVRLAQNRLFKELDEDIVPALRKSSCAFCGALGALDEHSEEIRKNGCWPGAQQDQETVEVLRVGLSGEQATHTFKPGEMGITYDDQGLVEEVRPNSQAKAKGIRKGYKILKLGPDTYSEGSKEAVAEAEQSGDDYEITFKVTNYDYQPWLVCCLRPNDKGNPTLVSRPVLLRQVRTLQLADMIFINALERDLDDAEIVIWPHKVFLRSYGDAGVEKDDLKKADDDKQACQLIVDAVVGSGSDQAIVGAEVTYGTGSFKQMLDDEVAEARAKEGLPVLETEPKRFSGYGFNEEGGHAELSWGDEGLAETQDIYQSFDIHGTLPSAEAARILEKRRKATLEELHQELAEREQLLDEERWRQEQAWQLLEAERVRLRKDWQPSTRGHTAKLIAKLSTQEPETDQSLAKDTLLSILPKGVKSMASGGGRLTLPPSELRPTRSMSAGNHAILHANLWQMAATLRVAKESEIRIRDEKAANSSDISNLRQECNSWRAEADRLWAEVQDLQKQLGPFELAKRYDNS